VSVCVCVCVCEGECECGCGCGCGCECEWGCACAYMAALSEDKQEGLKQLCLVLQFLLQEDRGRSPETSPPPGLDLLDLLAKVGHTFTLLSSPCQGQWNRCVCVCVCVY